MKVLKILISSLFLILCSFSNAEKLTLVADEWAPFSGKDLVHKGVSLHIIKTALTRSGYDIEDNIVPWARIMDSKKTGEYTIVGSLFMDNEMARDFHYSQPYYDTQVVFLQQKDSSIIYKSLDQLQDKSIVVGDGFLYTEEFDQAINLNKVIVVDTVQGIRMVAFGRADLTLDSQEVIRYILANKTPEVRDQIKVLPNSLGSRGIRMAVSKKHPQHKKIVNDFNRELVKMKQDGTYLDILKMHNSIDI